MTKSDIKCIDPFSYPTDKGGDYPSEDEEKYLNSLQEAYKNGPVIKLESKPGEYDISAEERGELINKKCPVCSNEIERVYRKTFDSGPGAVVGPGNKAYWKFMNTRCKNCRVVFDY